MLEERKKRLFVIEIEKREIVRKTSESRLVICDQCRAESDFISVRQAASIFSTAEQNLINFINENRSHFKTNERGEIFICLNSFIEAINKKTKGRKIKLLGDTK